MSEETIKIQQIKEDFQNGFEKFSGLQESAGNINQAEAENLLRELGEIKIKYSGKKSEIAGAKKLIGKVAPEDRGVFGQFVQNVEREIVSAIEDAEENLQKIIGEAKTEKERIDVTLPGRRPRVGHLHLITLLRQQIEDILSRWAIRLKMTARSKLIIIISTRSIFPKVIRRANRRTRFIRPAVSRFVRKPRPCKFARWNAAGFHCELSRPAESFAATHPI